LRDPKWRRFGLTLLAGKALGLCVLFAIIIIGPRLPDMLLGGSSAMGQATTAPADPYAAIKPADHINALNTVWTLLGAFLVFGMQAGFTMLEAGFCRSRETVNVLVECVFDTCLCGILYYAWGYAFMFGAGSGFIGWHDPNDPTKSWFFLQNVTAATLFGATGIPVLAHWLFQFAFADCASTICSGTMIGRTAFWGDILYSVCVSGFIYPIIGHWCWGPDGFLALMGSDGHFLPGVGQFFHDFAGSTVVHSIGGWIALAGAFGLGQGWDASSSAMAAARCCRTT
jgi:Amt family ammonium transporter